MGSVFDTARVSVSGLSSSLGEPEIQQLHIPYGSAYGSCTIAFPEMRGTGISVDRSEVSVAVNGSTVFRGTAVVRRGSVGEGRDIPSIGLRDVRWLLAGTKVGQHGIGDLDEELGGFATVGYQLLFNPNGIGNKAPDDLAFTADATAVKWTLSEMLEFVLTWYADELLSLPSSFSSAWEEEADHVFLFLQSVPDAIDTLCALAGESWGVDYSTEPPKMVLLNSTPSGSVSLVLPERTSSVSTATDSHILSLEYVDSVENSCDSVEVHTARERIETTHSNEEAWSSGMVLEGFKCAEKGYVYGFKPDVTAYEAAALGKNLTEGSRPKRWLRYLCSQVSDTSWLSALDSEIESGRGALPEQCLWLKSGADGAVPRRIVGGFSIRFDRCELLFAEQIELANGGGARISAESWASGYWTVYFTVATEMEFNQGVVSVTGSQHVSAGTLKEAIYRSDMVPMYRINAMLPDLTTEDEDDTITAGNGAMEAYVDLDDRLLELGKRYRIARGAVEYSADIRTLGLPAVKLGNGISISGASVDFSGNEVVTSIDYDLAGGDFVVIRVTNNIARLIAGEL